MKRYANITEDQRSALKTYVKMVRALNAVTVDLHRHLAADRLTVSQFGVLEALFSLGPLCQQDIGRKILKTSGNMTMVIDNLEKRGLVRRERDSRDRRYTRIWLTRAGLDLIGRIFPRHAENAQQVFAVLSLEERNRLGALLKKLGAAAGGVARAEPGKMA